MFTFGSPSCSEANLDLGSPIAAIRSYEQGALSAISDHWGRHSVSLCSKGTNALSSSNKEEISIAEKSYTVELLEHIFC